LHYVLITLSKLMAPFTPFIADEIYKNLTGEESVHLSEFPASNDKLIDEKLNDEMRKTRETVRKSLQRRADASIKVRQPLNTLSIKYNILTDLLDIIKEEVNVKNVVVNKTQDDNVILDTEITKELKLEGIAREIIRHIQEMRKEAGFEVDNRIEIGYISQSPVFSQFEKLIAKETLANKISEGRIEGFDINKTFEIASEQFEIFLRKE
jgi:isoleucyl-tRNA synthetase